MSSSSKLDPHVDEIGRRIEAGESQRQLAKDYGVARSTIQNFIDTRLKTQDGFSDGLREETDCETEIPVIIRDYSHLKELYVYPLGDVHKGSSKHAADRWSEWIDYLVTTPQASMLGTGDFFNAAVIGAVSDVYDEELTVKDSREELSDELAPLAEQGRIDGVTPGNHEDRIWKRVGDDPLAAIARELDIPYVKGPAVYIYRVGDVEYTVSLKHGRGGGQIGARANRLAQQARTIVTDIYISGHTHSQLVFPQELFVVQDRKVKRMRQLFVSSGSFLNYELYAAEIGLPPTKIGAPRIRLDGTRHDAHVSV